MMSQSSEISSHQTSTSHLKKSTNAQKKDKSENELVVLLDLETTGLVNMKFRKYPNYRNLDAYKEARVIQIGMILCSQDLSSIIEQRRIFVKANDFDISEESFKVHSISKEKTLQEGKLFVDAIRDDAYPILSKARYLIAHNIKFDVNVLKSELYRGGSEIELQLLNHIEKNMKQICTMEKTKLIVNAKSAKGRLKNPSLDEMYKFATGKEITGHHDALDDVRTMLEAVQCLIQNNSLNLYRKQEASLRKEFDARECKNELMKLRIEVSELKKSLQHQMSCILEAIANISLHGKSITIPSYGLSNQSIKSKKNHDKSRNVLDHLQRVGTIKTTDISPESSVIDRFVTELPSRVARDGHTYYIDEKGEYGEMNSVFSEYGENIGCIDDLDLFENH